MGLAYGRVYPEMIASWLGYFRYSYSGQRDLFTSLLCKPFEEIQLDTLEAFRDLFCRSFDKAHETRFYRVLASFVENNIQSLSERSELTQWVRDFIGLPASQSQWTSHQKAILHNLIAIYTQQLDDLALNLKACSDPGQHRALFEQWQNVVVDLVSNFERVTTSKSGFNRYGYDIPADLLQWEKDQKKLLERARLLACESELLGSREIWKNISDFEVNQLKKAGVYLPAPSILKMWRTHYPDEMVRVNRFLDLVRTEDKMFVITGDAGSLSERSLVVIATRSVPEIAAYIVSHGRLSLQALAEIGCYHPDLIQPLVEQGDFQSRDAVPALVHFAKGRKKTAEAILAGKYNSHLTPSWKGRLAAGYPEFLDPDENSGKVEAALHWRSAAESFMRTPELIQSADENQKRLFLSRWPYLKAQWPESTSLVLSLEQAFSLLEEPARWDKTPLEVFDDIACRFPAIAAKIYRSKPIVSRFSEARWREICLQHQDTAYWLIQKGSTNDELCLVLRRFRTLYAEFKTRIPACTNQQIASIYSACIYQREAMELLKRKSATYSGIRNRLEGEHWAQIASAHKEVAMKLHASHHKDIYLKLSPENIATIALEHEEFLGTLLSDMTNFPLTSLKPESWVSLYTQHPRYFPVIYQEMLTAGGNYQEANKPEKLLSFRKSADLWEKILATVNESDRQWLLTNSKLPIAYHTHQQPPEHRADFYPFSHKLLDGMPLAGCCSGYSLDFIRHARKGWNPIHYVYKNTHIDNKPTGALPYRVAGFQKLEVKDEITIYDHRKKSLELELLLDTVKREKEAFVSSKSHANALVMVNKDLYYFDPNHGIWRWVDFDPLLHSVQLKSTIEETLLLTGGGSLNIQLAKKLPPLHFLGKRKRCESSDDSCRATKEKKTH